MLPIKYLNYLILNKLDDKDMMNVFKTNKANKKICDDEDFWFQRILIKFPYLKEISLKKYKRDRTWAKYYIDDLRKIKFENVNEFLKRGSDNGRLDQIIISLNLGAYIHLGGNWPLHLASEKGHLDVVKFLVEKGADIHVYDDYALYLANKNGHLNVVNYLESLV